MKFKAIVLPLIASIECSSPKEVWKMKSYIFATSLLLASSLASADTGRIECGRGAGSGRAQYVFEIYSHGFTFAINGANETSRFELETNRDADQVYSYILSEVGPSGAEMRVHGYTFSNLQNCGAGYDQGALLDRFWVRPNSGTRVSVGGALRCVCS